MLNAEYAMQLWGLFAIASARFILCQQSFPRRAHANLTTKCSIFVYYFFFSLVIRGFTYYNFLKELYYLYFHDVADWYIYTLATRWWYDDRGDANDDIGPANPYHITKNVDYVEDRNIVILLLVRDETSQVSKASSKIIYLLCHMREQQF